MSKENRFVWIDLEMTGLDPQKNHILEIATIITDDQLNIIAHGPEIIIQQPEEHLQTMEKWVQDTHNKNGLLQKVKESTVSLHDAEQQTYDFIQEHCAKGTALLAGNSVWKDREFLQKYMPKITNFLFYRMVDVSVIKTLVTRWYPKITPHQKSENHRALEDIIASINELKFYREIFFIPVDKVA